MLLLTELRSPGLLGIRSGINCPGTTVAESCGGVDGQIGIHCGLKEDSGPPNPTSVQWLVCAGVLSRFLCPSLWDPMDYSPPGSSVHGISQARILKWVVISFSRESSQPRDWTLTSYTGRWILYHWALREAWTVNVSYRYLLERNVSGSWLLWGWITPTYSQPFDQFLNSFGYLCPVTAIIPVSLIVGS